jgi:hypothetical protein
MKNPGLMCKLLYYIGAPRPSQDDLEAGAWGKTLRPSSYPPIAGHCHRVPYRRGLAALREARRAMPAHSQRAQNRDDTFERANDENPLI